MKYLIPTIVLITVTLLSCKGEKKLTDNEKIEESVRSYLFIGDSIEVDVEVSDTIYVEELNNMINSTEENIFLVQMDLDTLNSMIDTLVYELHEGGGLIEFKITDDDMPVVSGKEYRLIQYRYKFEQLKATRQQFSQTNRILYHLKRSVWANISGFEVIVRYNVNGESVDTKILMDADFNVVD